MVKRFTEVSLDRRRAELYRARSNRALTHHGILFAVVAYKLDLYWAKRRLEKEICSFYCVLNQCTWCAYKTPSVLDNCLQLCICHFILIFDLSTLLQACFQGILYSMSLGKMEVISRDVPFDRVLTFLEVIGLHDFHCAVNFTSLHRLWHLCNLQCAYTLFCSFPL